MSNVTVFIGDSVTDCGRIIEPPFGGGYVFNIENSAWTPFPISSD